MTNAFLEEFTKEKDVDQFMGWLHINSSIFINNMIETRNDRPKELREWIKLFLLWSEYEENKDGD